MDRLTSMKVFAMVVENSSFARAAARLGVTTSMVTKHVGRLEAHLGVRLINRTTRRLGLTEAGAAYHERCVQLLADLEETEASVGAHARSPRGLLRVTAPAEFAGLHLGRPIALFLSRQPEVRVDLNTSNRIVDLIDDGFDCALRISPRLDSRLVARKLATSRLVACASPAYLRRHGTPRTPAALAKHACVCFSEPAPMTDWEYTGKAQSGTVKLADRLRTNQSLVLLDAALDAQGVALLPTFLAGPALAAGTLRRVLPDLDFGSRSIFLVYPHRKLLSAKVRAFVEFMSGWFGPDPEADPFLGALKASMDARRPLR
jgi:DNA-binding transcriptional LysR family regulator